MISAWWTRAIDQGSDAGCGGEDLAPFGERAIGGHQGANPNSRHNSNNEVVMAPTEIFEPEFECHFHHRHLSPSSSHEIRLCSTGSQEKSRKVIMKTKLAVIAFGALVLMANGANAQHRTGGHPR
jgi:hypothetical protein